MLDLVEQAVAGGRALGEFATSDYSAMAEIAVAMLALFAHMERVFMRERATHAREVASAKGKRPGRPRKLTADQLAAAQAALAAEQPVDQVATPSSGGGSASAPQP